MILELKARRRMEREGWRRFSWVMASRMVKVLPEPATAVTRRERGKVVM